MFNKNLVFIDGKWEEIDSRDLALYKFENPDDWTLAKDNHAPHKYEIAIQCLARQEEKYFGIIRELCENSFCQKEKL